jgi:hypothetical protein
MGEIDWRNSDARHAAYGPTDARMAEVHAALADAAAWNRINATTDSLTGLREEVQHLRTAADECANDFADAGLDAERAFGRVEAYDAVLKLMAHLEEDGR